MSNHKRVNKRTMFVAAIATLAVACLAAAAFLPVLNGKTLIESIGLSQGSGPDAYISPGGRYVDYRTDKSGGGEESERGVVLNDSSKVDELNDVGDKLKQYLKTIIAPDDSNVIIATYGDYAIGEADSVGVLWGPGPNGQIEALLYTDLESYSCDSLRYRSVPPELIKDGCLSEDGSYESYE